MEARRRIARFGVFEADLETRELRREGRLVALQEQPFLVLALLLERAGEEVPREHLRQRLWPDQAFLEFETGINTAVGKLRQALGDSADNPRFIATRPRHGYRFITPVQWLESTASPAAVANGAVVPANKRGGFASDWWLAATSIVLAIALGAVVLRVRERPAAPSARVTFSIAPPAGTSFSTSGGFLTVSPDGRFVAFIAADALGKHRVWLRALDSLIERPIPQTEDSAQPFWSADSRRIAFFSGGKLKTVEITGGSVQTVCALKPGAVPLAGTWNAAGDILFSPDGRDIVRVSAAGGVPASLIHPQDPDITALWPQFLPDGRHFVYVINSARPERTGIYVGSIDSRPPIRISPARSFALYSPPRHLLYIQEGTLVAHTFDVARLRLIGEPIPVAERVAFNTGTARGTFAVSTTGVLAYQTIGETRLTWADRTGRFVGDLGAPGTYSTYAISPDATRVAAARVNPQTGTSHIWVLDARDGREQRLTIDTASETRPLWSRDGHSVAFHSAKAGPAQVYTKAIDSQVPSRPLLSASTAVLAEDWDAEGDLLFQLASSDETEGAWLLGKDPAANPRSLRFLESFETAGRLSPDRRWLAYRGYAAGWFIYVRSTSGSPNRQQVSTAVNQWSDPRWREDGRELFYLAADLSMMSVEVEPGAEFRVRPPTRLFRTDIVAPSGLTGQSYDVTPDGQRFLMKVPVSPPGVVVTVNWMAPLAAVR